MLKYRAQLHRARVLSRWLCNIYSSEFATFTSIYRSKSNLEFTSYLLRTAVLEANGEILNIQISVNNNLFFQYVLRD